MGGYEFLPIRLTAQQADWARERIWGNVVVTAAGCWEYQAARSPIGGYTNMRINGKRYRVHRISYAAFVGPLTTTELVCHSCDNPPCVNPAHLWLGSPKKNSEDAAVKGRLSVPGPRGASHPAATLADSAAFEAIRRHKAGERQRDIAHDLGVSQSSISLWVNGKRRRLVDAR